MCSASPDSYPGRCRVGKRIPGKMLPHRRLVSVRHFNGGGANGRHYDDPVIVKRALIAEGSDLIRDQYDSEVVSSTTIYLERSALPKVPTPDTEVTYWAGTADERTATVVRVMRHKHDRIADLLEVKLR